MRNAACGSSVILIEEGMGAAQGEAQCDGGSFVSTHWTLVRDAVNSGAAREVSSRALAELCRIYWPPIYGYVRRRGYQAADAQDLTQSFFLHLFENDTLRRACRERGRFRNFLLGAVNLCLADESVYRNLWKRGGRQQFVALEELEAEEGHHQQMSQDLQPDELLDARWARVLLDRTLADLRNEYSARGEAKTFAALAPFLGGEKSGISYETVAAELSVSLAAVKTLIHRLRRAYGAALRREIMQTVSAPHEIEQELRELRTVFARSAERQAA